MIRNDFRIDTKTWSQIINQNICKNSLLKDVDDNGTVSFDELSDEIIKILKEEGPAIERERSCRMAYSISLCSSLTLNICHPEYR